MLVYADPPPPPPQSFIPYDRQELEAFRLCTHVQRGGEATLSPVCHILFFRGKPSKFFTNKIWDISQMKLGYFCFLTPPPVNRTLSHFFPFYLVTPPQM